MSLFRTYLMGIVSAAMVVALAQALTPEGTVKKVGRLVGGIVLLLAVVKPLIGLSAGGNTVPVADWLVLPAQTEEDGEQAVLKELIVQRTAEYIEDKGHALGMNCTAQVTVTEGEGGWPQPWSVEITGSWTGEKQRALAKTIEEELAIPVERQSFREETP